MLRKVLLIGVSNTGARAAPVRGRVRGETRTGTVQTANPPDIDTEIRRYVDLVVKGLSKQQVP
jgi:hypothetical protein